MPLFLKVMIYDSETGAHGESKVELRPDAVRLTRHSFLNEYCGPAIAVAWDAAAKDAKEREFAQSDAPPSPPVQ